MAYLVLARKYRPQRFDELVGQEHIARTLTNAIALGRAGIANPDWPREARTPGWEPKRPPLTRAELAERAVSPAFIGYLTKFRNLVAD